MTTPTTLRTLTVAVAASLACAAFVPAADAQRQDLRSPDVRDLGAPVTQAKQDLRSPDTRDAAQPVSQDLRSPDVRDVASGYSPAPASEPVSGTSSPADGGFDWVSAAIGVAAVGGVLILLFAAVGPRRRHGAVGV
jgi:hypothetical protein